MGFLSYLGFGKVVQDGVEALAPPAAKDYTVQPSKPKVENKEYYRVGRTIDDMTTLTLINHEGWGSMTLTMNQEACEQLIRMLRSTYQTEVEDDHA